ncbi:MAG: hypothetical protein HQL23_08395, partial [Candidatus Omnitrophica bacterium]|nr:hypothetical protein [Candidatus Omnitrophota bacterium]
CFDWRDYVGTVKVRVTRWDEDQTNIGGMFFAGGTALWNALGSRTERGGLEGTPASPALILDKCDAVNQVVQPNPVVTADGTRPWESNEPDLAPIGYSSKGWGNEIYGGAFMMSRRVAPYPGGRQKDDPPENTECWNLMSQLLTRGVTSESCAKYYHDPAKGIQFKFVPCKDW